MKLVYEGRGVRIYEPAATDVSLIEVRQELFEIEIPVRGDFYQAAKASFNAAARDVVYGLIQNAGGEPGAGTLGFELREWPESDPDVPYGHPAADWRILRAWWAYWPKPPADCPFPAGPCVLADEL